MRGSTATITLILAAMLTWTANSAAEDDPAEGRVPLIIRARVDDGGVLTFFWLQKEGRPVKIADPRAARFDKATNKWVSETYFVPTEPDKYVFEVTVKDENGLETSKRVVQEVLPATPLPIADAGKDSKSRVGQKVVLSGQDSKAFNNRTITKWQWTIKEAPEGFKLPEDMLMSRQMDFIARLAGKYIFELKVFDGKRWGDPASVEVVVTKGSITLEIPDETPNQTELVPRQDLGTPPVRAKAKAIAVLGDNKKQYRVGDTIVLDGSQSVVSDAETPRFFWVQKDDENSPRVRTLSADLKQPFSNKRNDKLNYPVQSFVALENGSYKFALKIETNAATIESEPVVFQVGGNSGGGDQVPGTDPTVAPTANGAPPPAARVTANKTQITVGEEVTLDGSKSTCDAGALTYIWSAVPGKKFPSNLRGVDGPIARFSAEQEGEYGVMLVVNDGKKQSASEPVIIKVIAAEKPPAIELEATQKCNVGDLIVMEAKIKDPQDYPVRIRWTCLEPKLEIPANLSSAARFRFSPNKAGSYLFQVEATNSKGLSAVAQTQIGVKDAAQLKPTAEITGPERAAVGDKVVLSGAKSFSPTNKSLTYLWSDISEGGAKIKDAPPAGKKEWSFKITDAGRHIIALVVNDGQLDSDPYKFYLDAAAPVVAPPEVKPKPVAKILGPKTVPAKIEVELSAESSTGEGPLTYSWTQPVDGAPDLGLTAGQRRARTLKFTPLKAGSYTLNLDVMDQNNQRSDTAVFVLEVKAAAAAAPTAVATLLTKDPSGAGKEVRLSADRSSDAGGAQLTYKWKQTKGPPLVIAPRDTAQEIVVTPAQPGAYELQVTVNNGDLDSAPAPIPFNVTGGALPTAVIAEITPPAVGDTVILDGLGSHSPNGAPADQLQFAWKQKAPVNEPIRLAVGDDKKSKLQFVVPAEGVYVWELTVYDGNDWSEPAQITFQARGKTKNIPPVAVVDRPVVSTEVGVPTTIDASASNDPDKGPEPLTFRWRKGNNDFKEKGPILKFTPPVAGTFPIEVEAFDGKDYSEPVKVMVNVLQAGSLPVAMPVATPNPAPVASKKEAFDPQHPTKYIVLDGTKSHGAPDKTLTYTWRQVGGDNLRLKNESLAKDRVGIRVYKAGDYRFELVVNDGENNSLPATVDLKVVDDDTPAPDKQP